MSSSPATASANPDPTPVRWPARLAHDEARHHDLDARIRQAEQRLIAREEDVRRSVSALLARGRAALQPRRLLAPVLGAVAAGGALWWLLRTPSRRARLVAAAPSGAAPVPMTSSVPWVRLVGLAWPLLPPHWRSRVSPATASTVVTLGLPLMERLIAKRRAPPLATVPEVDLVRYAGTWYEVARLPTPFEAACDGQPTAHYGLRGDGSLDIVNACPDDERGERQAAGIARPVPGSGGARLELSFWPPALRWLPWAWSDYWILHVDEHYREALVGTPSRDRLWLLSRRPRLAPERRQALVQIALDRGYPIERLQFAQP